MARPFRPAVIKKGRSYFEDGRVAIVETHEKFISTRVAGKGDIYEQVHFTDKTFLCNCPSHDPECSHIIASRLAIPKEYRPLTLQERNDLYYGSDEIDFG